MHNCSAARRRPAATSRLWLLLALCSCILQAHAATRAATHAATYAATCNARGDALLEQEHFEAAVEAFHECSHSHGDTGPVAAWSQYRIYDVQYWHLRDKHAAAAACRAGWEAYKAPELAWCLAFSLLSLQQHQEAKQWAAQAISVGCFQGSCNTLTKAVHDPSKAFSVASHPWESPFEVLQRACRKLGDTACADEAFRREYQAKFARRKWSKHMDLYQATKHDVSIPRGPALRNPEKCERRLLPQRPAPPGRYEAQLHVLTFATNLTKPELGELLGSANAHGIRVTILQPRFDFRGHWGGRFGLRLQLVTNYANMIPDEDYIMFVDGYDVVISGNSSSIIDGFHRATQGRDVALFAAETGVWPVRSLEAAYPPGPTRYRFLNAGTWMATAHAARCMMSAIDVSFDDHGFLFTDDQWVFANAFIQSSRSRHPIIALDYYADVFASLYDRRQGGYRDFVPRDWACVEGKGWTFKLTGRVPKVWHASGNQGQHWMQDVVLPHAIASGRLGRPAPCSAPAVRRAWAAAAAADVMHRLADE